MERHKFKAHHKAWGAAHTGPGVRFICTSDAVDDADHKGFWTTLALWCTVPRVQRWSRYVAYLYVPYLGYLRVLYTLPWVFELMLYPRYCVPWVFEGALYLTLIIKTFCVSRCEGVYRV